MKPFIATFLALALVATVWYLFVKEYDYQIRFKTKYGPEAIYYDFLDTKDLNPDNILSSEQNREIVQKRTIGDTVFQLQWTFEKDTDSTTQVKVNVRDDSHTLGSRLDVLNPFSSAYSDQLKSYFKSYNATIDAIQSHYYISNNVETTTFSERYCVCASSTNSTSRKASDMLNLLEDLNDFFSRNTLKPSGDPLLFSADWNQNNEAFTFDFCFPIQKKDSLTLTPNTRFVDFASFKAYTTVFKGNYKLSHRAWASLKNRQANKDRPVSDSIIEVYHNSPLTDTNSDEWSATIYVPISN